MNNEKYNCEYFIPIPHAFASRGLRPTDPLPSISFYFLAKLIFSHLNHLISNLTVFLQECEHALEPSFKIDMMVPTIH